MASISVDEWAAIAVAAATIVLVLVTGFYAFQTRETVKELRRQHDEAVRQAGQGVTSELEMILHTLVESAGSNEAHLIEFSDAAWKEGQRYLRTFPEELRPKLFRAYVQVYRMNGVSKEITARLMTRQSALELLQRRNQLRDELQSTIQEILDWLNARPSRGLTSR